MTPGERPIAPAVARNRDAILSVLRHEFASCSRVLEIGSGTGEHAVYFAEAMPWLEWQCSDRRVNHAGIAAWVEFAGVPNVRGPIELDVDDPPAVTAEYDAVFTANTAHIMSQVQVAAMCAFVGEALEAGGTFCLYGPFNRDGEFTSQSNARFDASLRAQDPLMGIRALEDLDALTTAAKMTRRALYAMPANNFTAVWQRNSNPD